MKQLNKKAKKTFRSLIYGLSRSVNLNDSLRECKSFNDEDIKELKHELFLLNDVQNEACINLADIIDAYLEGEETYA